MLFLMGLPVRCVGDESHQKSGDETGSGHGDEPTHVDPANHAPVDRSPIAVAETDTDNGTSDTLGSRDRKLCKMVSYERVEKNREYILRRVARMTVITDPNSIEKPRAGDINVTLLPKFRMML